MKKIASLLSFGTFLLLGSCVENNPSACECAENLDLVVNYEQNAATTYVGQFNKDVYEICLKNFKEENGLEGEILITKVFDTYQKECQESL